MIRTLALILVAMVCTWPAVAGPIQTGKDLVQACSNYLGLGHQQDNNAARAPHPCRAFLQGFFVSLIERERAKQDAMIKGIPYTTKEACVRMPDFLSYRDMAGRVVNFGQRNPALLPQPAAILAQRTLEHNFPCPPPPR